MKTGTLFIQILVFCFFGLQLGCGESFEFKDEVQTPATRFAPQDESDGAPDDDNTSSVEYIKFEDIFLKDTKNEAKPKSSGAGQDPNTPAEEGDSSAENQPPSQPTPPPPSKISSPVFKNPPATALMGKGSVYYLPVLNEKRNCADSSIAPMMDPDRKVLARLCAYEIENCAMQGSCFYVDKTGVKLFGVTKVIEVVNPKTKAKSYIHRFKINELSTRCPQGMGVQNICLDPYRSIAADPKFHKSGDVVFIPKLYGRLLPNGEIHDGYFIVRDRGGRIKGQGRFDFFIGFDHYQGHLFAELNLIDVNTSTFEFYRVPEILAKKIRLARNYPLAPKVVHARAAQKLNMGADNDTSYVTQKMSALFYRRQWSSQKN